MSLYTIFQAYVWCHVLSVLLHLLNLSWIRQVLCLILPIFGFFLTYSLARNMHNQGSLNLIKFLFHGIWASLVAQLVKNPPAVLETWLQSLDWEDPSKKGTITHSRILIGEFHWLDNPWHHKESDTTGQLSLHFPWKDILDSIQQLFFSVHFSNLPHFNITA